MMETSNMNYEERSLNTSKAVGQCVDQISLLDPIQEDPGNELHEVPNDMVDHPNHYQAGGLECIDVMEQLYGRTGADGREAVESWIKLTIFKYIWRADKKDGAQDIDKIRWYSEKLVKMVKEDGKY